MLTKEIENILKDEHPECVKKGHRVHTTYTSGDEMWPVWGKLTYGVASAFVHFESEEDGLAWREFQIKLAA